MTLKEQEGYEFANGVIWQIWRWGVAWFIGAMLVAALLKWQAFNMNDSDKDKWNRSGFRVMTDYKTGIQYLSDGCGGLVKREQITGGKQP